MRLDFCEPVPREEERPVSELVCEVDAEAWRCDPQSAGAS